MDEKQFFQLLLPSFLAPLSVAFVAFYFKNTLNKMEQISTILIEIQYIKDRMAEFKVDLDRLNDIREQYILTKNEVKTQWNRYDELKEYIKRLKAS